MSSTRPSRPHNGGGGLPSGPRSRSVGRDRDAERMPNPSQPPIPLPSLPRSLRPQRSLANLPSHVPSKSLSDAREWSRPPPVPTRGHSPRSKSFDVRDRPHGRNQQYSGRSDTSSARSSGSDSSSSSLLDRMKAKSGYSSSRTSWEEDPEPERPGKGSWFKDRAPADRPASPDSCM